MKPLARYAAVVAILAAGLFVPDAAPLASQQPAAGPQPPAPAPGAPQTPPAGAPQAPGGAGGGQGRGGGRGNPAAALYTERCAACHGTVETAGRSPNLFDDQWTRAKDDEGIAAVIADGVPQTEMIPFKALLTDQQIWQLVAYLRTQAANAKPRPTYVPDPDGQEIKSEKQTFRLEVVAREIETPWGLAFLPDGRLLVTERAGKLRIIPRDKSGTVVTVTGTPKVWERQDAGMFDVEVHPQYAKNGWIYLSYAEPLPNYTPPAPPAEGAAPPAPAPGRGGRGPQTPSIPSMTTIVRGKIGKDNAWIEQQVIFRAATDLFTANNTHFGSRFTFDRAGEHLFYTIGERGVMENAQDLSNPSGKVHRVNDDGSVPKDNPFVNRAGAVPTIWSYGHRNPQGLAWDASGRLWESEHGPQGGDEINVIERGKNYGWGVITMGVQNGITKRSEPGMEQPIVYYTPTIAPSGITFYTGSQYPSWRNNLFVSALAGQQLRRLEVTDNKVTAQEALFNQFGRVHDVVQGPDGLLYVTLQLPGQVMSASTPGMVARLVPLR